MSIEIDAQHVLPILDEMKVPVAVFSACFFFYDENGKAIHLFSKLIDDNILEFHDYLDKTFVEINLIQHPIKRYGRKKSGAVWFRNTAGPLWKTNAYDELFARLKGN